MAIRTIEALKAYFYEHAYPTWRQFHDVLDSFRHKSDKVPITDVDGLSEQLNGRVTNSQLNEEIQARTDADTTLQTNIDGKASSEDLSVEIQARTNADTAILGNVTDETNARIASDATLQAAIDDARAIAEGRSKGRVFDTINDMNSWLAVPTNTATLNIGDHLLIKALNVPDYWWDGTGIQKLETEKVDLTGYVQKERKINGHDLSIDVNLTADDIAETSSRGWLTSVLKSAYDGAVTWISTNGANLVAHLTNTNNPHSITAAQVGLDKVNNTADMDKPVSTAVQTALNNIKGIGGTSYIYVTGKGTAAENATELQAAYDKAKTMMPYGANLTQVNRIILVVGSGTYTFAAPFAVNSQCIDIVSLTGRSDVMFSGINVTANDVLLRGINCGTTAFTIATNLNMLKCECCTGGNGSFGSQNTASGTFSNCTAGSNSFGGVIGTGGGIASGIFTNCTAGSDSFGGNIASGKFTNCTASDNSFGRITASGIFSNCVGGNYSFGVSTSSGTFTNCTGASYSFGSTTASGTFTNCTAGMNSFGYFTASGTFTNCTAGIYSFGYASSIASTARLYYCRLTSGTFRTPNAGGRIILCVDGSDNIVTI